MKNELEQFKNKKIVIDTRSSWLYVGELVDITENCAVLADVDVHDSNDTSTSKEIYLHETRGTGIKSNRKKVFVNLEYVISFSLLEDVRHF